MRKRDGRPFTGVSIIFEIVPHSARFAIEKASFLKINDMNDILFLERLLSLLFYSVSGNANSIVRPLFLDITHVAFYLSTFYSSWVAASDREGYTMVFVFLWNNSFIVLAYKLL
jgi:hypothetical protein